MSRNIVKAIWISLLTTFLAVSIIFWDNSKLQTNIFELLPSYQDAKVSQLFENLNKIISNKIVIAVSSKDNKLARQGLKEATQILERSSLFKKVDSSINIEEMAHIYQTIKPYKNQLLEDKNKSSDTASIINIAMQNLYGIKSVSKKEFSSDPLGLFSNYLSSLSNSNSSIKIDNGNYLAKKHEKFYYLIFVELSESAFDLNYQKKVTNELLKIKLGQKENIDINSFGAVLYSSEASKDASNEINTVGIGSLIGILILFLLIFRSLKPLFLSLISIGIAIASSFFITSAIFGNIHIFTLIFSSTIIGISIDYYIHFYINERDGERINTIRKEIKISFISTVISFMCFLFIGINFFAQVAVFTSIGLFITYINVILLFPKENIKKEPIYGLYLIKFFNYLIIPDKYRTHIFIVLTISFISLIGLSIKGLDFDDDIGKLQNLSPALLKDEVLIRDILNIPNYGRYLAIFTDTIDEALGYYKKIEDLSWINTDNSMLGRLPLLKEQKDIYSLYNRIYQSSEFREYLNGIGMNLSDIDKLGDFKPINYQLLYKDNKLNTYFFKELIKLDNGYALVLPVKADANYLDDVINIDLDKNRIKIIEQRKDLSSIMKYLRINVIYVIFLAILFLAFFLGINYGIYRGIKIVLIPSLSVLITFFIVNYLGYTLSLFNCLSALLLLGIGIDYMVFLQGKHKEKTLYAVILASITTILSFGLLALSNIFVISSFGITTTIGVILIVLLSIATREKNS